MSNPPLSAIERIKQASLGLRGTIKESLTDAHTGAIRPDDQALVKFHGMYLQDDRDRREIRAEKKLERLYSFMVRLRLPGGFLTPEQWICLHHVAGEHTTGVIKITTRQTVQLHGILKSHIRPSLQAFNLVGIDSIATCGDVNRNVIVSGHPAESPLHSRIHGYARKISEYLKPKTRAWYEIWIGEEKLVEKTEDDPLYQDRYMPRKFKVGIAIPPNNDPDVYANDVGLVAIIENDKLLGFNVAVGGGMGATHGNEKTYPRVATPIGFVEDSEDDEKLLKTVYAIATVQRDFGDRSDRSQARLKYTLDRMGVAAFRAELEKRLGYQLEDPRPVTFTTREDHYGWVKDPRGLWNYTVFAENGRVLDDDNCALMTATYEVAQTGKANIRFTANQGLIIADIQPADKKEVHAILQKHRVVEWTDKASVLRKNSIACVALPTCPLALSESQRYMPVLITKIETLLEKHGLQNENIITRMTGCPNGCGRSRLCEIGFVGTAPGVYNMYIGGDHVGTRLNQVYRENVQEPEILEALDELFLRFAKEREAGEHFGDFALRKELVKAD